MIFRYSFLALNKIDVLENFNMHKQGKFISIKGRPGGTYHDALDLCI